MKICTAIALEPSEMKEFEDALHLLKGMCHSLAFKDLEDTDIPSAVRLSIDAMENLSKFLVKSC